MPSADWQIGDSTKTPWSEREKKVGPQPQTPTVNTSQCWKTKVLTN